ncbi:hypothetical protein AABC73_20490 [Pseudomonas sp. G.S.17]|uniref:hypothetical protein n=1 Tax=Pseudomonas sp. G.S.17 TaxID=3137451 RepID=UPI00311CCA44
MDIIYPVKVTPAILTSTNVPENDYAQWVAGTYVLGDRRIIIAEHLIYEVTIASTTDSPLAGIAKPVPSWRVVGPTNPWRMFDDSVGTLTTNPGSIVVVLTPGTVVNSMAFFNLGGRSVRVTMVDPTDGLVFDRTISLVSAGVSNWYDYFFSDIETQTDVVFTDMPAYGTASISVQIDAGSGIASAGHTVIGKIKNLGCVSYGADVGAISFSRKERDTFGSFIVVKRSNAKRSGFDITFNTNQLSSFQRTLMSLDAVPVVWIGSPLAAYEGTVVFGFYRDFTLTYEGPRISRGTINIEGLT